MEVANNMKLHLFCYVNHSEANKAKNTAKLCKGTVINKPLDTVDPNVFSDPQFNVVDTANFVSMEFVFDGIFDLNSFCYKMFMASGFYFFIENIIFAQ